MTRARNGKVAKLRNLLRAPNTYDRLKALLEVKVNSVFCEAKPAVKAPVYTLDRFREILKSRDHPLAAHLAPNSECHKAVESVRRRFSDIVRLGDLPFSVLFNADLTLALLSYAVVRCRRPEVVIESGVGYGITSALVLLALEAQGSGQLLSFDLPPLSDVHGAYTGLAVPEGVKQRWSLERNVTSRGFLPKLLETRDQVDIFISDSANVNTLQRFELSTVWPKLSCKGLALFNNISAPFQRFLIGLRGADIWNIWQIEKPGCVTTLIEKH